MHAHRTEDGISFVRSGEITFHRDGQDFPLLIFTFKPSDSPGAWDGYVANVKTQGTRR